MLLTEELIEKHINAWDPVDLICYNPHEYDIEVRAIYRRLPAQGSLTVEVLAKIIYDVFYRYFNEIFAEEYGPAAARPVAEKILADAGFNDADSAEEVVDDEDDLAQLQREELKILEETYRGATPQLIFDSPFELLVAVILSAQCTDKRVNQVTQILFPLANTPEKILQLGQTRLQEIIKPCGYFRAKAKHIFDTSKILLESYGGEVPSDFDELIKLPGVGRKTANVVTSVAFKTPAIAVDTHVFRLANRLLLAQGNTPLEVERGLQKIIPRENWSDAHHWLIWHGREICRARNPKCHECPLSHLCPSSTT